MNEVEFWKVETLGNDFVLMELFNLDPACLSEIAIELCNRKIGIGSDGLLVVGQHRGGLNLRMFNPDGSEDFCGNGLRCAAQFGTRQGWVATKFTISHGGFDVPAMVDADGSATVVLPPAQYQPEIVPLLSQNEFIEQSLYGVVGSALSTGSTHFVVMCDDLPHDDEFFRLSPVIEHDPLFPERTSVMYVKVLDSHRLKLRIWERGAGETLGCGTGSAAAAVEWARISGNSGSFHVENPGGNLEIRLPEWTGPIESRSLPKVTFTGRIKLPSRFLASAMASKASLL